VEVIEPGVSINISLMATNIRPLRQALQHVLLKNKISGGSCRESPTREWSIISRNYKGVPGVIKDFEKSGGAEWILPCTPAWKSDT
jgi:hypothetical protein